MAAGALPVDVAQIVALFLESMFYGQWTFLLANHVTGGSSGMVVGIYLVSFGYCLHSLLYSGKSSSTQRYLLLFVALLLFTVATLDLACLVRLDLDAFIYYKGPGGAIGELSILSLWVNVMKTVAYVAQTSIADAMLASIHPEIC